MHGFPLGPLVAAGQQEPFAALQHQIMVTALQTSPATLNLTGLPTAEGADVLLIEIGMAWQHQEGRGGRAHHCSQMADG